MSVDARVYFSEDLEIQSFDGKKVGQLLFSVKQDENCSKYVIELHSKWQNGSILGGVTSHAILNEDLLIEKCEEMIFYKKDILNSQTVKILPLSETEREVLFIQTEGDAKNLKTDTLILDKVSSVITIGTSYLYQRLAALGRIELLERQLYEIDIGCKLAEVRYEISRLENVDELGLKKESNKGNVLWIFKYGPGGELKFSEEEDTQLRYTHIQTVIPKDTGVLAWNEDVEMISKYLDEKDSLETGYIDYIRSHPRIRGILADYLHHILIRKPDDVFHATAEFFKPFVSENI
ncbi:Ciliogenesis-associated TTC17-interacting protein [Oopsacas minuta]|uniref:Ciliogenesis-associated TTC17-interacting protein n=1 Tax=Oopsacas minuta TaxID=111878 RepID=A0AAV7JEX0_9METZ|nr:Ciliogenesis-associated TTC17-interacting protein [Oopsacas minuta]